MDPVSLVGLISALTQLASHTGKIVISLSNYCSTVKNAPARSKELCDELETVSAVLHSLTQSFKIDPNIRVPLLPISALEKAAHAFDDLLHSLEQRVDPISIQGYRRYIWPLRKSMIEKSLAKLERHKATFSWALNVQHMYGLHFRSF